MLTGAQFSYEFSPSQYLLFDLHIVDIFMSRLSYVKGVELSGKKTDPEASVTITVDYPNDEDSLSQEDFHRLCRLNTELWTHFQAAIKHCVPENHRGLHFEHGDDMWQVINVVTTDIGAYYTIESLSQEKGRNIGHRNLMEILASQEASKA